MKNEKVKKITGEETKFVGMEKNLIQIGFFSVPKFRDNNKSPKDLKKEIQLAQRSVEGVDAEVKIYAPLGLPTTGDLTKYLAFQDLIQERARLSGKEPGNPIAFTNYELLSRLNLTFRGGKKNSSNVEIREWLDRMKATTVKFFGSNDEIEKGGAVAVFDRVEYDNKNRRDPYHSDDNLVWLSEWEQANLYRKPLVPIDLKTYRLLENETAKILVPHLQIWLYASQDNKIFHKNYSDFCRLLGVRQYSSLKEITRVLEPAMHELKKFAYIKKWEVSGMRSNGFKISLWHGAKFFQDLRIFDILSGGTKINKTGPAEIKQTNLELLPEMGTELTAEENVWLGKLTAAKINKKNAIEILSSRKTEEIEAIFDYCQTLFLESPEKYTSPGGYLFTLLKNKTFEVPHEEKNQDSRREKNQGGISGIVAAAAIAAIDNFEMTGEDFDALKKEWLTKKFDEYCFAQCRFDELAAEDSAAEFREGASVWEKAAAIIKKMENEQVYNSWFAQIKFAGLNKSERTITLLAAEVTGKWITNYYGADIPAALAQIDLPDYRINWLIDDKQTKFTAENYYQRKIIEEYRRQTGITFENFLSRRTDELEKQFAAYLQNPPA